jgi:Fe-Mn family superoxide dismutase
VTNTNKLLDTLAAMLKDGKVAAPPSPEYAELKRRLGWEFNGMRLHELYFENLGGAKPLSAFPAVEKKLAATFGSAADWEKDFRAAGTMRGIGWVVLYQDGDRLMNFWVNEHDVANPAGCAPILVMDVFEHAFMVDYGLKRADYVEAFMKNINWETVAARLK